MNTSMVSNQRKNAARIGQLGALTNISMGWKMGLMASVLILGMVSISSIAYLGAQNLRYQLSNIYDFMLIPIVAINHADAALADAQIQIMQSQNQNVSAAERIKQAEGVAANNQITKDIISRYNTDWVTTVSPDFTQALSDAGKLPLQEQEVDALSTLNSSFEAYQASFEKYLAAVKSGNFDEKLANESTQSLITARSHLQELIDVNSQYAEFSNATAQAATQRVIFNNNVVLAVGIVLGLIASYLIVISITGRLSDLTRGAIAMQTGNLDQSVEVVGRDEISLLGAAFNDMTSKLRISFATLEQRVAARTKDLATVAEVGTATATILESDRLLQEVVDLTKERFDLYHSHIYLLDESGENLVLASGAGEPGRQMKAKGLSIPLSREQSLVARSARERKGVTVNDVTQSPDFLPNPLLPNTRSELAVPMIVGGKVIGVFDVQSDQVGRFTESDINIQTTLASQVATSIQNVRSFERSKEQAEFETLINTIGQKIQRAASVEDTLQTAIREIGLALGASRVSASIGTNRQNDAREISRN
ncbi:MAG: GAF domain-containing protein [Anaerolineales bacterium]|nr:GAF domain-containing protein [Anaerolineales bacterium]